MKRIVLLLTAMVLAFTLTACQGKIEDVRVDIGPSEIYSEEEIDDAVYETLTYFQREFGGCSLTRLEYIESKSADAAAEWAKQYDADQAIVLVSTFEVTGKTDGSLAYGETYQNWQWILVRNNGGKWQVKTCGY